MHSVSPYDCISPMNIIIHVCLEMGLCKAICIYNQTMHRELGSRFQKRYFDMDVLAIWLLIFFSEWLQSVVFYHFFPMYVYFCTNTMYTLANTALTTRPKCLCLYHVRIHIELQLKCYCITPVSIMQFSNMSYGNVFRTC